MTSNLDVKMEEEAVIEFNLSSPTDKNNSMVNKKSALASVIIEELDEDALTDMNVDMNEFVEAKALNINDISQNVVPEIFSGQSACVLDVSINVEDQDILMTADEEDLLTKQFLNGELTFSEYSSRIDPDVDLETAETGSTR